MKSSTSSLPLASKGPQLSRISRLFLGPILCLSGLFLLINIIWKIEVLRGKRLTAAPEDDGWRLQHDHGTAAADVAIGIPLFVASTYAWLAGNALKAHYLFSLIAFWFVYAKAVETFASIGYLGSDDSPSSSTGQDVGTDFLCYYPIVEIALGLSYLGWIALHFDRVFLLSPSSPSPVDVDVENKRGNRGYCYHDDVLTSITEEEEVDEEEEEEDKQDACDWEKLVA